MKENQTPNRRDINQFIRRLMPNYFCCTALFLQNQKSDCSPHTILSYMEKQSLLQKLILDSLNKKGGGMILLGINRQMSEGLFFSEEEEERIRQKVYRIFEDILKTNKMPNIVQEEVSLIKRPDYKLSFVPVSEGEEGKQQKKVLRIVVYPEENKTYCIKNKQGITYKKEEVQVVEGIDLYKFMIEDPNSQLKQNLNTYTPSYKNYFMVQAYVLEFFKFQNNFKKLNGFQKEKDFTHCKHFPLFQEQPPFCWLISYNYSGNIQDVKDRMKEARKVDKKQLNVYEPVKRIIVDKLNELLKGQLKPWIKQKSQQKGGTVFEFGTIEEAIFAFIVIRNKNRRSVKFHDIERGWQSNQI